MFQLSASLTSSMESEPGFTSTIPSICLGSTEMILGAAGVLDAAGWLGCLPVHHTMPLSTTRTPRAVNSPPDFMLPLSPLPPDRNTRNNHDQRQENHAGEEDDANGGAGDMEPPVFGFLRADRNEVFIRSEPIHHIEGEVAVADRGRHDAVGHPAGTSHHDDSALFVTSADGGRRAEHEGALLGGFDLRLLDRQLGIGQ